ncbi:hypothetical protein CLTEP_26820 [Clostridium tepidiprofundi DSM 19306]|uniref:DUF4275 domain-containing protein n=1 Tax=Clostridium tepidiprofundi DSM 19306 TaxID=1121338 RepID=A0A151AR00_9CLOT|nr:DUF4275 family protein [Clostridium tepidiprofundi]KYH30056.1 hypothetical protein CLTEP_26820 [Clostridium tepidiprofundi DSM 19306]
MQLIDILKSKKVKVIEIPKWGTFLRKQWEDNFANHLRLEEKKAIHLFDDDGFCGFLWHIFSYEKRECLKGEKAEQAFDNMKKSACYVFFQHTDDVLILEDAAKFNSNDLLDESDVYVVDKEFNWTYVKTHETGYCGPYFSRRM